MSLSNRVLVLVESPNGTDALKFTNLLSRLLKQNAISRKSEVISFLTSVASQEIPNSTPMFAPRPSSSSSRRATRTTRASTPAIEIDSRKQPIGKSKAELLKEYRKSRGQSQIPEILLLRDAIYILQGISGKFIHFASNDEEVDKIVFVEDSTYIISTPTKTLVHRLAELGYLYRRVNNFIREREGAGAIGMIEQRLCHHLQSQLNEYYRLIAILETQMLSSNPQLSTLGESSEDGKNETGVSLKRLDVWLNDWRLRMQMMSVCVERARESQGGALVNLIHSYTDNGDPFIRKFTHQLLEEVCHFPKVFTSVLTRHKVSAPFFSTLHKWLFSGELYDPFGEFFVAVDSSLGPVQTAHPSSLSGGINELPGDGGFGTGNGEGEDGARERSGKLWETKYQFRKAMLPHFVGESSGKKVDSTPSLPAHGANASQIFSTGKSLNFIRYSCHDSDWVVTREKMSSFRGTLKYSDVGGLEKSIDSAYRLASHRLFEVFIEKFKLLDHLSALKNYMLLGHGDFADQLMEALGPSLARAANTLYRHNLTATLETAIRTSIAQHDPPEVLRRLDARMLEYSHGEIGWDVFTLEYKVDTPIDTVLDDRAMEGYLKLFRHLWQMKRTEKALDRAWMRIISGARAFLRLPELEHEWHKIRITVAEMIHFIRQLGAFCRLEVIECSWNGLIEFLDKKEGDLDSLINAHRSYLDRVVKKIFLLNTNSRSKEARIKPYTRALSTFSHGLSQELVLNLVKDSFSTVLMYREALDNLYNYCLSEAAKRDQKADQTRGVYTGRPESSSTNSEEHTRELTARLHQYGSAFTERVHTIVQHLQVHPDLDCRFLAIRLSFSDYYKKNKDRA
ncbi:gamma-tubulin complex component 3 [Coprinopsis cinerea AmutBmut pab1-1]|nr:gamma-tubulin complex component 3 [Coprinopsis cinerea AmutBmut pab1-1]